MVLLRLGISSPLLSGMQMLLYYETVKQQGMKITVRNGGWNAKCNFGFNFPWWDRLFGTYRAQPVAGHEKMAIGLSQFRKTEDLTLPKLLILPFTGIPGRYSINYIGQDPEGIKTDKQRQ